MGLMTGMPRDNSSADGSKTRELREGSSIDKPGASFAAEANGASTASIKQGYEAGGKIAGKSDPANYGGAR